MTPDQVPAQPEVTVEKLIGAYEVFDAHCSAPGDTKQDQMDDLSLAWAADQGFTDFTAIASLIRARTTAKIPFLLTQYSAAQGEPMDPLRALALATNDLMQIATTQMWIEGFVVGRAIGKDEAVGIA